MRFQFFLFFIFTNIIFSQNELYLANIDTLKKDKEKKIVAIDKLGNEYSINENEISKNDNLFFSDFSLGNISSIDLYNPLKIKVWYGNYNTLIILDNFLNEITRVNFRYSNEISHVSTSNENSVWTFDQLSMKIRKFDYINKTYAEGIELLLNENVIDIKSNYNFLWILTDNYFYMINYNGSIIYKSENKQFKKISLYKNDVLLSNSNSIIYFNINDLEFKKINSEKLFLKDFFVINETLYIYNEDFINKYLILTK